MSKHVPLSGLDGRHRWDSIKTMRSVKIYLILCSFRFAQRILKDQKGAISPDTRSPFRSPDDACLRLLRYHVYQEREPSEQEKKDGMVYNWKLCHKCNGIYNDHRRTLISYLH